MAFPKGFLWGVATTTTPCQMCQIDEHFDPNALYPSWEATDCYGRFICPSVYV